MSIEGQSVPNSLGLHEFETHIIHQTHVPPILTEQALHAPPVQSLGHPVDVDDRKDALVQVANRLDPQTMLQEGGRFHDHVVCRHERSAALGEDP